MQTAFVPETAFFLAAGGPGWIQSIGLGDFG
jgi:hypothetical protein